MRTPALSTIEPMAEYAIQFVEDYTGNMKLCDNSEFNIYGCAPERDEPDECECNNTEDECICLKYYAEYRILDKFGMVEQEICMWCLRREYIELEELDKVPDDCEEYMNLNTGWEEDVCVNMIEDPQDEYYTAFYSKCCPEAGIHPYAVCSTMDCGNPVSKHGSKSGPVCEPCLKAKFAGIKDHYDSWV